MFRENLLVDFDQLVPVEDRQLLDLQRTWDATKVKALASQEVERTLVIRDTSVKQQPGPQCTSFAVVAAMENIMDRAVDLDELHLYQLQRRHQSIGAAVQAAGQWIAEQSDKSKLGRCRLSDAQRIGFDWIQVVASIDAGHPLVVGFRTPRLLGGEHSVIEAGTGVSRKGGHAVSVVGYRVRGGNRYFLIKNSWGPDGDLKGYYWIAWGLFNGDSDDDVHAYADFYRCKAVEDRLAGWNFSDPEHPTVAHGALVRHPMQSIQYRITATDEQRVSLARIGV